MATTPVEPGIPATTKRETGAPRWLRAASCSDACCSRAAAAGGPSSVTQEPPCAPAAPAVLTVASSTNPSNVSRFSLARFHQQRVAQPRHDDLLTFGGSCFAIGERRDEVGSGPCRVPPACPAKSCRVGVHALIVDRAALERPATGFGPALPDSRSPRRRPRNPASRSVGRSSPDQSALNPSRSRP